MNRRICYLAATAICAAVSVGLNASNPFEEKLSKDKQVVHALNRLAFGPRPGDVDRVKSMGLDKWIDAQLHPERFAANPALEAKLAPLETLRMSSRELVEKYPPRQQQAKGPQRRPAAQARSRSPLRTIATELMEAKLQRALYSERQLEEVLADFWFNHFNVHLNKGADRYLVTSYERDAIRPHVLGKFQDLVAATATHPAMLFYLDNWQSVDPQAMERAARFRKAKGGAQRPRGLNENYGRELLELHTLGVDGGFTQQDVIEVARCFTGWSIRQPRRGGDFFFNGMVHDRREKTVLGAKIAAGGGIEDGRRVIEILAAHPSTARHISMKLAQRFVADQPPKELVDSMAETFRKTGGDIRAVMRAMIQSREFFSEGAYRAKLKSPLEIVVSAARALDADVKTALALSRRIDELGQPLYRKEEPTGYSNNSEEWVNTAGLLGRMNFGLALTAGELPGARADLSRFQGKDSRAIARAILHEEPTVRTRETIAKGIEGKDATPALIAGLVIGSPDFQRR